MRKTFITYVTLFIICFGVSLLTSCKHETSKSVALQKTTQPNPDLSPSLTQLERIPSNGVTAHTPTLILLHGLGSNEKDLFSFAQHFGTEWLVLSPRGPISIGQNRYSWFPLHRNQSGWTYNYQDVTQARESVIQYVNEVVEKYGVNASNVCLGGFSQGAILSLATGLKYPDKIKGIVSLSGHLYPEVKSDIANQASLSKSRIFISHGKQDQVLPHEPMRQSVKELKEMGIQVSDYWYNSQHTISSENFKDLLSWLENEFSS